MNIRALEAIIGGLLGDGSILMKKAYGENRVARYCEGKSLEQKSYLEWKAELLSELHARVYEVKGRFHYAFLQTNISHPLLNSMRQEWYPKGIKTIGDLRQLDQLGLAIWYMDDGQYVYSGYPRGQIKIATGFAACEVEFAEEFLMQRWGINSKTIIHDGFNYISLSAEDSERFLNLVREFIHPSMIYKLGHLHPANQDRFRVIRDRAHEQYKTESYREYHRRYAYARARRIEP